VAVTGPLGALVKLGEERVAVRSRTKVDSDDYGNDVFEVTDTLLRWCSVTPARSTEPDGRTSPAIAGATLFASTRARTIEAADAIIWPISGAHLDDQGRTVYEGREWEVQGEVGDWGSFIEAQIRRQT
jgi:hypothetical protein